MMIIIMMMTMIKCEDQYKDDDNMGMFKNVNQQRKKIKNININCQAHTYNMHLRAFWKQQIYQQYDAWEEALKTKWILIQIYVKTAYFLFFFKFILVLFHKLHIKHILLFLLELATSRFWLSNANVVCYHRCLAVVDHF